MHELHPDDMNAPLSFLPDNSKACGEQLTGSSLETIPFEEESNVSYCVCEVVIMIRPTCLRHRTVYLLQSPTLQSG